MPKSGTDDYIVFTEYFFLPFGMPCKFSVEMLCRIVDTEVNRYGILVYPRIWLFKVFHCIY